MDDLLATLNKVIGDVNVTKLSLDEAVITEKNIKDAVIFVKKSLETAKRTKADEAFTVIVKETKKQASVIYAEEVNKAASQSEEYAYGQFLSPLLDVGNDENLYDITPIGAGWNRSVTVVLDMDGVAGNIQDYAEAVESARGALGTKEDRDPSLASSIWRRKIYKGSRYYTTINLRLLSAGSPAPFWSLLNYGSKNVSMESDIGGTPYPSRGAHRFVEHTEDRIRKLFRETFVEAKERYIADEAIVTESILEAELLLKELQVHINNISKNSELMSKIAQEINTTVDRLNASKVLIALKRIRSGDIFTTQVVVGDGLRIRTKKFIELTGGYGE